LSAEKQKNYSCAALIRNPNLLTEAIIVNNNLLQGGKTSNKNVEQRVHGNV